MSKCFAPILLGSVLFILFPSIAFTQNTSQQVPNIGGNWKMSIIGENRSADCTLIQKGNALTGTFRGQMGDLPVTGTVGNDKKVAFSAKFIMGTLKFSGRVEGQNMKGVVDFPMGRGQKNWLATKQ
jgi:hypothetical protein